MADRSIKFRTLASPYQYNRIDGIRIRIEIVCATGLTDKVFAYRMLPTDPLTGETKGHFSHICSPVDIEEWPANEPVTGKSPEWFRLSYVDVMFRSVSEAAEFRQCVKEDLISLKYTLGKMDLLQEQELFVIGEDCDPPDVDPDPDPDEGSSSESLGLEETVCAKSTSEVSINYAGANWTNEGEGAGNPDTEIDSLAQNYTKVTLKVGQSSDLLVLQGFDFSEIPLTAQIQTISAAVRLRNATPSDQTESLSLSSNFADDPILRMVSVQHPDKGLSVNKAAAGHHIGPEWEEITYGGDDTWELEDLTGKDLRDGSFGVSIMVGNTSTEKSVIVEVDFAEICVTYQEVFDVAVT